MPESVSAALDDSVAALSARYDPLLAGGRIGAADLAELTALARVFDLDADADPAEVWRDLRAVLTRQAPGPDADPSGGEARTLLVVEDDADMAVDLTELLTEAGHRVVGPFHNAAAAEVAAALHPVDLALVDINLSDDTTGVDLARSLKGRWGVRSIFLSGDVTQAARHAELAEALLTKPYGGREVLAAVARATA